MASYLAGKVKKSFKGRFSNNKKLARIQNLNKNKEENNSSENLADISDDVGFENTFQLTGRRVVELDVLAKDLDRGCTSCGAQLKLSNSVDETISGLGSFIYISCDNVECGELNVCTTNKSHRSAGTTRGRGIFDVNTKLAAGMLHAGVGATHINAILSSINVPTISEATLKSREREIGPVIENVAKASCSEAFEEEKKTSCTDDEHVSIGASYDMGWQKRGKGHNSLTGAGSMIGIKSGKVIAYGTRTKRCATCEAGERLSKKPKIHDCRVNWAGSSKAMEPDLCAELVKTSEEQHSAQIGILVGDDDSSTIKTVKESVNHQIKKWSDIAHVKRSFGSSLYNIQAKHKKQLSTSTIEYFQKCFGYAIKQNKDDVDCLKKSLNAIVPHAFGKHHNCEISWCGFLKDPTGYKHSSIPHDLHGESLESDLQQIIQAYVRNAEKIAPLGSSQPNESLNNIIGSKAPKIRHYGASESNDYRVACAVSQKNIGHSYVTKALENINLSPGSHSQTYADRIDKKRRQLSVRQKARDVKKQRSNRKKKRTSKTNQLETREGPKYQTGIGLQIEFEEGVNTSSENIPSPSKLPKLTKITTECVTNYKKVVFDLETSSRRGDSAEICQIAAKDGVDEFNVYVLPKKGICASASAVNHLTFRYGILFCNGRPVDAVSLSEGLRQFLKWLQPKAPCLLVAHNVKAFDAKHLIRALQVNGQDAEFKKYVHGFADTLTAFKEQCPERKSNSLENLAKDLLGTISYDAHNALGDVQILQLLMSEFLTDKQLSAHSFSIVWMEQYLLFLKDKKINLATLTPLINAKVISKGMAEKAAASGLNYNHLLLAFKRNSKDGIFHVLQESFDGQPRVTKNRKVISKICSYFQ